LESILRERKVQALKAQLALSHHVCSSLAKEFETPMLTDGQRAEIADRLSSVREECRFLQLALDLLERRAQGEKQINKYGAISSAS
jgi:hypothetical protein